MPTSFETQPTSMAARFAPAPTVLDAPSGETVSASHNATAKATAWVKPQKLGHFRSTPRMVIGRCWPVSGPKVENRTNTPVQTVHADFPHTAYQWSVGSQHYAGLLLPGGLPG